LIARRSLLAIALIAGSIAGALYFMGAQRVPVVVAALDLEATRPLTALDVEVRSLPPDALPPGAITSVEDVIGRVPVAPLWQGQPFVPRERDGTFAVDRIASVIIAISPADEIRFADRIVTSTFVLAYSSAR
jgi:Flp pilus assembly protein CpaB